MNSKIDFRNKKVLVMGLGVLGGGLAVTKWLVKHGAKVTVTDLKTKRELKTPFQELGKLKSKITLVLGRHRESDFRNNEMIVVNPGVPKESKFLKIAKKNNAAIENEASLFFRFCPPQRDEISPSADKNPIIAVTGTRGKTTTANWIYHFLKKKYPKAVLTGNSSDNPMLNILDKLDGKSPVVVELSSWQLELLPKSGKAPHIAVITNLYRDHMNRHKNMRNYALAKANIFSDQNKNNYLILNKNNSWTKFFLKLKPQAKIIYFPNKGIVNSELRIKNFESKYGKHNLENLSIAILVARKIGVSDSQIKGTIKNLPQVKYREEIIYQKKGLTVVNDSTATSPDATIAALRRFGKHGKIILISGGTDKELEFNEWARMVKKYVKPENLYLLNGNATKKMIMALLHFAYFKKEKPQLFEDLKIILMRIKNKELRIKNIKKNKRSIIHNSKFIILFSPSSASFEKFKNEFDRGEKFNLYLKSVKVI